MNSIEEKLWNYIDGSGSPDERQAIGNLIETDEIYRRKYEELLDLNLQFNNLELDEPAMNFTYKVMEAVRAEEARVPLKAAINTNIIKGITGFFILTIAALIVYTLLSINWTAASPNQHAVSFAMPDFKLPPVKNMLGTPVIKAFIFFDLVLGLFWFDAYLRKQRLNKSL